jgi:GTP cyclohydrolase II
MIEKIQKASQLYREIADYCHAGTDDVVDLEGTSFFGKVLESFGPALVLEKVKIDLREVYCAAFHRKSGALIVANKGANFIALSPFTSLPFILRHLACSVYHPLLGIETVNIGLAGNIYEKEVIVRAESACPPSFLFGSQRCNCHYQWASIRELAAHFNRITLPEMMTGDALESWIAGQFVYREGRHLPAREGRGVILMHLDSQAGMGSGYSEGECALDLYSRAVLRQLGENTAEHVFHTSLKEGYELLGIYPDSRRQCDEIGYRIPAIILDWLNPSRQIILLSNNAYKIKQFQAHGFEVQRVKSLGKIHRAGQREATQRGADFDYLDMEGEELSFEQEIARLKEELAFYN